MVLPFSAGRSVPKETPGALDVFSPHAQMPEEEASLSGELGASSCRRWPWRRCWRGAGRLERNLRYAGLLLEVVC